MKCALFRIPPVHTPYKGEYSSFACYITTFSVTRQSRIISRLEALENWVDMAYKTTVLPLVKVVRGRFLVTNWLKPHKHWVLA